MNSIVKCYVFVVLVALAGCGTSGLDNSPETKPGAKQVEICPDGLADPLEMDRTWQAALLRIPKENSGKYLKTTMGKWASGNTRVKGSHPTVIYLHGRSGIRQATHHKLNFLAKNGYAVIAPVSFARKYYPKPCTPSAHQGVYQQSLEMRQHDAEYAITKAKMLDWVDGENVFLMGFSQGGIITATFSAKDKDASLKGRVVEGWGCIRTRHHYEGINAPNNEPVLTLVGKKDPVWKREGNCEKYLHKSNGSKSVVFSKGALSRQHELLSSKKAKNIVIDFLRQHTNQVP